MKYTINKKSSITGKLVSKTISSTTRYVHTAAADGSNPTNKHECLNSIFRLYVKIGIDEFNSMSNEERSKLVRDLKIKEIEDQ